MNIFWLSSDLEECARFHCNKHVVKQILEYTQLLCTAINETGGTSPYKTTHKNHPCAVWVRERLSNFRCLSFLAEHLCQEYTIRYGKVHKCESIINGFRFVVPNIPPVGHTLPPLCMPDEFKVPIEGDTLMERMNGVVQSYRNYYLGAKSRMLQYKNRDIPTWVTRNQQQQEPLL